MKKTFCILLIILILCGCSSISQDDCISKLNTYFENYQYSDSKHGTNNNTSYYNFYLPSDIQEIEYEDSFHHFIFNLSDFVMNLNVNYILCDKVFNKPADDPFSLLSTYSIYERDNLQSESSEKYKFCLYKIDDKYLFSLYTNKLYFFGKTDLNEIEELINHLFIINNSTKLDYDRIIDSYYLGTTIDFTQENFDLFDSYVNSSGLLSDLIKDKGIKTKQENDSDESNIDSKNNE